MGGQNYKETNKKKQKEAKTKTVKHRQSKDARPHEGKMSELLQLTDDTKRNLATKLSRHLRRRSALQGWGVIGSSCWEARISDRACHR